MAKVKKQNIIIAVKRKIDMSKINGVTISELGIEFAVHVPEEYDYRFAHYPRREDIIAKII